jgi:excisionase family DNA binding protein
MQVLRTPKEAAERLQTSVEQVTGFVRDGELRYVNIGRGKKRPRRMFTDDDLDEFIERRKRRDACLSTSQQSRRTGSMTSKSAVIAFSAQPKPGPSAKR